MTRRRARRAVVVASVVLGSTGLVGCGDDREPVSSSSATSTSVQDQDRDQDRDRDRDRDRLREAADDVAAACEDRDRDRLRQMLEAQTRNRVRTQDLDRVMADIADGTEVEVRESNPEVNGDEATVQVRLRIRDQDGTREVDQTWRFRWTDEGWRLHEVPSCLQ